MSKIDEDELQEMRDYFGINRNNSQKETKTESNDDEIDPLL